MLVAMQGRESNKVGRSLILVVVSRRFDSLPHRAKTFVVTVGDVSESGSAKGLGDVLESGSAKDTINLA